MYMNHRVQTAMEQSLSVAEEYWDLRQPSQAQTQATVRMLAYILDELVEARREIVQTVNALSDQLYRASVS
ncbi:hypothetical protein LCGC14_2161780 [marine sediment metagenome]|uniref:Uncharacterized protein n=1 Tax=marine sediment metagenome TaxID=412755 RepID=A0A0F9DSQ2_9ZZZZ